MRNAMVSMSSFLKWVAFGLLGFELLTPALALAAPENTEIDMPGFRVEHKKSWLGHPESTYSDALGNGYSVHHGWFGRTTTRGSLFGTQVKERGRNVAVTDANGNPLVVGEHHILTGDRTQVNGSGILDRVKDLFGKTP